MADIKTRQVQKGTIKSLDRAASMTSRVKDVQTKTKNLAEDPRTQSNHSPNEYASNNVTALARDASREVVYGTEKAVTYSARKTYHEVQGKHATATKQRATKELLHRSRTANASGPITAESPRHTAPPRTKAPLQRRQIKTFANRRQFTRTKGREKVVRDFTKRRTTQQSQKQMLITRKSRKRLKRATQSAVRRLRDAIRSTKLLISSLSAGGIICLLLVLICILFGAAFYCFGDESSSNYTPVSAEVEAYSGTIAKYANQYGIDDYTELIKAVMMQESGGRGSDPMQASESGYNKKYSHKPNSIKDPDYSIECGVQALASVLRDAKCKNALDMDRIRLALQGYNYGNGYISWAIKRDGGYTVENASDFSDEQAKKHGWKSYGDKQYPAHVLRYYPYGNYNYGIGNGKIMSVAAQQLGNAGGKKFWSYMGFKSRVEWCACFVSWCSDQCGYVKAGIMPKNAGVGSMINFYKGKHQWQKRGYKPSAGDVIFFDWEGDGGPDHVGLVEKCDGSTVYTIEGNSSDACRKRTYAVNSGVIYGYGIPKY